MRDPFRILRSVLSGNYGFGFKITADDTHLKMTYFPWNTLPVPDKAQSSLLEKDEAESDERPM